MAKPKSFSALTMSSVASFCWFLTALGFASALLAQAPTPIAANAAPQRNGPLFNVQLSRMAIGDVVPDLALKIDGNEAMLSDFRSRPLVLALVFRAIPNDAYVPKLNGLVKKYSAYGLRVAALLVGASAETYAQWMIEDSAGTKFSKAWDPVGDFVRTGTEADEMAQARWDAQRAVRRLLGEGTMGSPMMPAYLVIDADGRFGGWLQGHADFDDGIANLLLHAGLKLEPKDMPKRLARADDFVAERPQPLLAVGTTAPDFVATDLEGRQVKPSDYLGQVVLLDFWATWCGPCVASFPHTQEAASAYKDQGLVVLGSCTSDSRDKFEAWVRMNQGKYPDIRFSHDPAERAKNRASLALYGVNGIPAQFIIGRDGKLVDVVIGYEPGAKKLEAALAKAGVKVDPALIEKAAVDQERR